MHVVNGSTHAASGGMTGHTWTTARINGLDYVFDPQIDQNIGGKSNPTYYRFGKPYSELPGKYEPYVYNDFVNAFGSKFKDMKFTKYLGCGNTAVAIENEDGKVLKLSERTKY